MGYSLNAGFSFLYLCTPIAKLWDLGVEGTCVDLYSAYLVSSVLNAVTDVVLLALPVWLLVPLRVKFKHKMLVALALMPGGLSVSLEPRPRPKGAEGDKQGCDGSADRFTQRLFR